MKKLYMYLINIILLHIALQTLKGTEVYKYIYFEMTFSLTSY